MTAKHSPRRSIAQDRAARRAMLEKNRAAYIYLICGHFTTWDDDQRNKAFMPKKKGKLYWCEVCAKWVKRKPTEFDPPSQELLF